MKYLLIAFTLLIAIQMTGQEDKNCDTNVNRSNPKTGAKNVLGGELQSCCFDPITGWFRDGYCNTDYDDFGTHTVCSIMTADFLEYTKSRGNDLSSPSANGLFPGLKTGDKWCLCASRWLEAYNAGHAPKVVLESTNEKTLELVKIEFLREHTID